MMESCIITDGQYCRICKIEKKLCRATSLSQRPAMAIDPEIADQAFDLTALRMEGACSSLGQVFGLLDDLVSENLRREGKHDR